MITACAIGAATQVAAKQAATSPTRDRVQCILTSSELAGSWKKSAMPENGPRQNETYPAGMQKSRKNG
jgi:hypothetical protein